MKILINAANARLGGGQTYIRNLLRHIPDRPELDILIIAPAGFQVPSHPALRRLDIRSKLDNPIRRTAWERFRLPGLLKRLDIDVLFCPGGVVTTPNWGRYKIVTMFRNMMPFDQATVNRLPWGLQRLRNVVLRRVMLRSMANADLTIFISDYARCLIERLTSIRRAVTIPHGIASAFRTADKQMARPGRLPSGEYLLYVSRFDVYKHHYEVVTAYASLPDVLQRKYRLVLIGETNLSEAPRVDQLIEHFGLRDRVLVLGAVAYEELPSYYSHAALNIFASSCENCPNILLEALGAGRPLISSDVLPMPEFGGEAAVYFSPFDADSIQRAMVQVLTNEALAVRLARAAAQQSALYDWAVTARRTWAEIFALCETGARGQ